ncbi:hypothetical protein [Bartonella sp. AA18HLJMS]
MELGRRWLEGVAGQSFRCWRFVGGDWGCAGCRISGGVIGVEGYRCSC